MKNWFPSIVVLIGYFSSSHALFIKPCGVLPSQSSTAAVDTTAFLDAHNFYRRQVGSPDIHWSNTQADYAQKWATQLAQTCSLHHSNTYYGENIFWASSPKTEKEVVDSWAEESVYFNHKNPIYPKKGGSKCGHYSQVIWAKSTLLGAAYANCSDGGQIWVCVYYPAGNVIGERVY